ncbi:uncharacterized protein LOC125680038 [Ostrea edulis]|uniref:uncharacterized protein LOC125680038 n=1 Tax=Ostrea edulis TaxID=37623 RepID=UPI0024AFA4E5|nr:uncharacterized protein LOC125680038 [Ostrea edulis]
MSEQRTIGDIYELGLDLQFLFNDYEDLILSQACDEIEMNHTLGEIKIEDDMDVDTAAGQDFENFNLDFTNLKEECVENPEEPRFGLEVEESEIQALIESQENKNTKKNTQWALNIFESWRRERNAQGQGQELIIPEIQTMDAVQLNFYLGRFIMRVRRKDGKEYPAKTLSYISCGIFEIFTRSWNT